MTPRTLTMALAVTIATVAFGAWSAKIAHNLELTLNDPRMTW